jgi:hypothetical protein
MIAAPITLPLALHPFEMRPTPALFPPKQRVDELMLDWSGLPAGSTASIYMPAVSADDVLQLASSMYVTQRFSRADAHTLNCAAEGIVYLPVPKGGTEHFAGLLSITLPSVRRGTVYSVTVRQITAAYLERAVGNAVAAPAQMAWRRVLGTFQISLSVKTRAEALLGLERLYAVLLWIQEAIPPVNRWYPVFVRYLAQLAGRITGLGGDPGQIQPSPTGHAPGLMPSKDAEGDEEVVGKIEGIIYDHFGDFEGFIVENESGRHHRFSSREAPMLSLIRRAWLERTRVAVLPERHRPHVPRSVTLRTSEPRLAGAID